MSEFRVELNKLRRDASAEQNLAPQIRALAAEISAIARNIGFDSSNKEQIQKNLRAIAESSMNHSKKVIALSQALEAIAAYYELTETRISGRANKFDVGFAITRARENIHDLKFGYGTDSSCAFGGDPVNLSNGNYVYEKTFFDYDTILSMNLRLFYNASDERKGALGRGWRHNFEICLLAEGEQYSIVHEDGSERLFRMTGEGYVPYGGTEGSLGQEEDGFVYTDAENIRFCFDKEGRLIYKKTQDDWRVDLSYEENRLVQVSCTDGITLSFIYAKEGSLCAVSDQAGRMVRFLCRKDRLLEAADPLGRTTRYQYDESGRLSEFVTPDGITGLQNLYDEKGRTSRQLFPDGGVMGYEYLDEENAVVVTRQNGSTVKYVHDGQRRNIRNIYPDGEERFTYDGDNHKTSYIDKNGNISRYGYDENGRLVSFTNALGSTLFFRYTESGQVAEFSLDETILGSAAYDERNHQIRHTNAIGAEVSYAYDVKGRVTAVTHEDGSRTSITYDALGNVIRVEDPQTGITVYEYDDCRHVVSSCDGLGRKTCYAYDSADQLIQVIDPAGNTRNYRYDDRGNLIVIEDFGGGCTKIDYDDCARPIRYTDPDGYTTLFEYDIMGNIIRKTAADGGVTEYQYDSEGRRIRIQDPMGGIEKAVYDPMGNLIERTAADNGVYQISYDALNRPVSVIDPMGRTRSAEYDRFGNVTQVTYEDGTTESYEHDLEGKTIAYTDPCGHTLRYTYDALGDLTEVRDEEGVLARYEYLPGGRLSREFRQDGSEASYTYDAVGNVICLEDSANGIWNLTYDALDRIIRAEHVEGETESYEYDALGNIIAVIDGEGNRSAYSYSQNGALLKSVTPQGMETGFAYDPCYRLISISKSHNRLWKEGRLQTAGDVASDDRTETGHLNPEAVNAMNQENRSMLLLSYKRDLNGNVLAVREADGGITEFSYDPCGRIIRKKDADGYEIQCSYEKDGTEKELVFSDGRTIRYQYDALKRLEQIEDWLGITSFQRDATGRILSAQDPSGNRMTCSWSTRGVCEDLTYPDGRKAIYGYDDKGRLAFIDVGSGRAKYEYYNNGRLKNRTLPGGLGIRYEYDGAGRIRQLTSVIECSLLGSLAWTYDRCGRKRSMRQSGVEGSAQKEYTFSYNPSGCLSEVNLDGNLIEQYVYDGFGNRITSKINGITTEYAYDGAGRLSASRSQGAMTQYRYDRRGNLAGKQVNGLETLSLHFGALNRLEKAVSTYAEVSYRYDGLGRLVGKWETTEGRTVSTGFFNDYRQESEQLLAMGQDGKFQEYFWDAQPFFSAGAAGEAAFLQDERRTVSFAMQDGQVEAVSGFTTFGDRIGTSALSGSGLPSFGSSISGVAAVGSMLLPFGFTAYRKDAVTGFYHGGAREYDPDTGRFISRDPDAGALMQPVTLNPFVYCMSDPLNHYDPTGAVVAWLAGGIIGLVGNVAVRFGGDVVHSVKNGKWSGSSWQSYVGTAIGGFVEGSVFVVAGPTAAGAAGAATETLVTNGLNMATGVKGYRKEDGYSVGRLLGDTAVSGAKGAAAGFVFGKAGEHMTNYIRIPTITKGTGSCESVLKQLMTKAQKGLIKHISWKSIGKGIVAYGLARGVDNIIKQGIEEGKSTVKDYAKKTVKNLWDHLTSGKGSASISGVSGPLRHMGGGEMTATCPLA